VKPLIFMDIDGVLNTHNTHSVFGCNTIDKILASRFNEILEFTQAEWVLSSAWRYMALAGSMNLDGLKNLFFSHWVDASRLIGVTRKDISKERMDRGPQIKDWLVLNKVPNQRPIIVIDDLDLEIISSRLPLWLVDGKIGLTNKDVSNIILSLRTQQQRG
jgi:HAD domain in Swiss Army Knife RNA repair proteins